MPDVEVSSPDLVDPSLLRFCKAMRIRTIFFLMNRIRTILHGVMVTSLFSVIMFAYLYLYHCHSVDNSYIIASLVIQIIAYLALGCLCIYFSSSRQDKFAFAGYLVVLVMSVFLISSIEFEDNIHTNLTKHIFWANIVAISLYCVWKFCFTLPNYSKLKKLVRTILHDAIIDNYIVSLTIICASYFFGDHQMKEYIRSKVWLLIQLVAYNALAFLCICNSCGWEEKVIFGGLLVVVLPIFLLCSFANTNLRTDLIFRAKIVAISSYCVWKLYLWIQRWLDTLHAHVEMEPSETGCRPSSSAVNSSEPHSISEHGAVYMQGMNSRATESGEIQELEKKLLHPSAEPTSVPLDYLRSITHDFCKEHELGSGEYGVVYKGTLRCGSIIAIKKFRDRHLVHDDRFQNEASFLMGIKHQNLVQLLGFCAESRGVMMMRQPDGRCIVVEQLTRMLCFQYVCNQGLDKHLSDESLGLDWNTRYEIIKGICSGLNFLHEREILHLDLKPQNILLDATMMPKIADFGLSRLLGAKKSYTITVTSNRAGTMGYMAPEYINKGEISKKADIFSLGVIIIEILRGCKDEYPDYHQNTEADFRHFTEKVLNNWRNRFERAPNYTALELHTRLVKQCIDIALRCVHPDKKKRPNISNIIEILVSSQGQAQHGHEDVLGSAQATGDQDVGLRRRSNRTRRPNRPYLGKSEREP